MLTGDNALTGKRRKIVFLFDSAPCAGHPKRYMDYSSWHAYKAFEMINK